MGKKVWDSVSRHINASRTHYLKWDITKNISVRYHFLHQGNRELEGQFIIKIHSDGSFQLADRAFAKQFILAYKKEISAPNIEDVLATPDWEITGRLMNCPITNRIEFHKTLINMKTMETSFGIDCDSNLKTISYNPDGELFFREHLIMEQPIGSAKAQEKMEEDILVEKLKEMHGSYFSEPRFEKTLCNADNIEDVKNIAQCFYPQMEANKIVYNRPIDDPEFKEIDEYSKTKSEIVEGWSFKDQSGLKSKLESDYHDPIYRDLTNDNLAVVMDHHDVVNNEREITLDIGFGNMNDQDLKIKVVSKDDLVSLDTNTANALNYAIKAVDDNSIKLGGSNSAFIKASESMNKILDGKNKKEEDPNSVIPNFLRKGLPVDFKKNIKGK